MKKLTPSDVRRILAERPIECSVEDIKAIFKIIGLQIKEVNELLDAHGSGARKRIEFEIHHQRNYIIAAEFSRDIKICSFSNEFVNFGDGSSGVSVGIDKMIALILMIINFWLPKLAPEYSGPKYDERRDSEYKSIRQMQALLKVLQEEAGNYQSSL